MVINATVSSPPEIVSKSVARRPALPALTGIRTLLALGIILFHFTPPHLEALSPIIGNAFVFVGCFFLISGFILAYNYSDRAATLVSRDFWVARFSRLYPVYLLVLVVSLSMLADEWHARSHAEFWKGLVLTPLLLQGWSPDLATFWNTVAWTLSAEVLLYAAFPWMIRTWALRGAWLNTPRRLALLVIGLWMVGLVPHLTYQLANPDHLAAPADRYTSTYLIRLLKFTPLPYVCTFMAGVALGKLQLVWEISGRLRLALTTGALALLGVFFYSLSDRVPYILMHGGLMTPLFAALILGLSGKHVISRVFSWKPLLLLGETTYCLYLLHFNVYVLLHRWKVLDRLHLASLDPWISYVVLFAVGLAAFHFVEKPARGLILSRIGKPKRVAA